MEPVEAPAEPAPPSGPVADVALGLTTAPLKDLPIAFDTTFGWASERGGIEVSGARSYREVLRADLRERTVAYAWGAAARLVTGAATDPWRLEAGVALGYDDGKDGYEDLDSPRRAYSNTDTLSASGRLGVRGTPAERWALRASVSVGWARVGDDAFAVDEAGATVFDDVRTDKGLRVGFRSRIRRLVLDDRAALRGLVTADSLRGERLVSDGVTWTTTPVDDWSLRIRMHGDWLGLGQLFAPTLFLGLDLAGGGALTATPLVGLGFVQENPRD
jgi:hypothetical protein